MNVRIFWVRAMKCMCSQTRPRFILSSERAFGGMEFEPMLTPREKSPLPENVPRGGSNPRRCGQRAQALPTELFQPPQSNLISVRSCMFIYLVTVYFIFKQAEQESREKVGRSRSRAEERFGEKKRQGGKKGAWKGQTKTWWLNKQWLGKQFVSIHVMFVFVYIQLFGMCFYLSACGGGI